MSTSKTNILLFLEHQHQADLFISHDIYLSLCETLPPLSPTHVLEGTLCSLKPLSCSLHEKNVEHCGKTHAEYSKWGYFQKYISMNYVINYHVRHVASWILHSLDWMASHLGSAQIKFQWKKTFHRNQNIISWKTSNAIIKCNFSVLWVEMSCAGFTPTYRPSHIQQVAVIILQCLPSSLSHSPLNHLVNIPNLSFTCFLSIPNSPASCYSFFIFHPPSSLSLLSLLLLVFSSLSCAGSSICSQWASGTVSN